MSYTLEQLDKIFNRTSGYCHLCHKQMVRSNYGLTGERGAWQVEHSVPRAKGGTDNMNNLFAAHVACNLKKGTYSSRTARGWNGKTCAPLSPEKREAATTSNGLTGAFIGGIIGFAFGGPVGAALVAFLGGHIGASQNPDK